MSAPFPAATEDPDPPRAMPWGWFALAYAGCYLLGYALSFDAWEFATTWPASGLYLAVLATSRPERWPKYVFGALLGNIAATALLFHTVQVLPGLSFWAGDTLEALVAAEFLRRATVQPFRLRDHRAALALVLASLAGTTVSATVNTVSLKLAEPGIDFLAVWRLWWIADLVGCVVVAPLVCAWLDPAAAPRPEQQRSPLEAAGVALGLVVATQAVFGTSDIYFLEFGYLAYPFAMWAALRFGLRGATTAAAVFAWLVVANTVQDRGPFAQPGAAIPDQALVMQAYICTVAMAIQVLAAVAAANSRLEAQRTSELEFRELADTAPVLVWLDDAAGHRRFVNRPWREFTGQSMEAALAESPSERLHPDDRAAWETDYAAARREARPFRGEYRMRNAAGEYRWCLASSVPRRNGHGGRPGFVGTLVDITDLKYAEWALREAKEAADSANRAKSTFLAQVSHELRTPLANILGRAELLLDAGLAPAQHELAQGLHASAEGLRAIVDDLLDLMRVETGNLRVETREFPLRQTLDEALQRSSLEANRKGLAFATAVAADVPNRLVGDANRLRQILDNLTGNAVKFTQRGQVDVEVRVLELAARSVRLLFRVRDTGIGIAPERRQAIFEAFTQADLSIAERFGGSGLGLSIVARLARLLGGHVEVDSELGRGSEFRCELPFALADGAPLAVETPTDAGRPLRILLVEDNPFNQRLVTLMLETGGHEVEIVDTVRAAVERAVPGAFDVALLDLQLTDGTGIDAARRIRAREQETGGARLPLLALSAHAAADVREACQEAGIDGFLDKLAGRRRLLAEILRLVARQAGTAPGGEFRAARLLDRLRGNRQGVAELGAEFAATTDDAPAEWRAALAARDWTSLERSLHKVRGAAAFLEATVLLAALDRLSGAVAARDPVAANADIDAVEVVLENVRREFDAGLSGHTPADSGGYAGSG